MEEGHTASILRERRQETRKGHARTDRPPRVPRRVDLHLRVVEVGRVAEKGDPEVLEVYVVERLEDASVEFVSGRVGDGGEGDVAQNPPHAAHAARELLGETVSGEQVRVLGVEPSLRKSASEKRGQRQIHENVAKEGQTTKLPILVPPIMSTGTPSSSSVSRKPR